MTKKQWEKNPLKVVERVVAYSKCGISFQSTVKSIEGQAINLDGSNEAYNYRCVNRLKKKVRREWWILISHSNHFLFKEYSNAIAAQNYTDTIIKVREVKS